MVTSIVGGRPLVRTCLALHNYRVVIKFVSPHTAEAEWNLRNCNIHIWSLTFSTVHGLHGIAMFPDIVMFPDIFMFLGIATYVPICQYVHSTVHHDSLCQPLLGKPAQLYQIL